MKRRSVILLILGTLLYFFVNFQRTAIPGSIFNELQGALGVPAGSITALGSSFMYIYAFCQLVTGLMVDRYGGFRTILIGGLFLTIGSLFFPWSQSLWLMYLLRASTGLGASAVYLSMVNEFRRNAPKNFTTVFGTFMCIGYAGSIMAGAPFVAAVQQYPWHHLLSAVGLITTALYAVYSVTAVRIPKALQHTTRWSIAPLFLVFRNPLNRWYMSYSAINWGLYYTIQTVIGKKYLEDTCGLTAIAATWILTAMGGLSALSNLLSGVCSQLAGNRRRPFIMGASISACCCFTIMSIALACRVAHPAMGVLFLILTVGANMAPVTVAIMQEMNPPEMGGTIVAVCNAISYLSVAVISNICGAMLECFEPTVVDGVRIYGSNSYLLFFSFAAILAGFSIWAVHHLPETGHSKDSRSSRPRHRTG